MSAWLAKLRRDARLPVGLLVAKVKDNVLALALGRIRLRECDRVGPRARCFGTPRVDNAGRIFVGSDVALGSKFGVVSLATSESGIVDIEDGVTINYGTSISAKSLVRIGAGAKIGPFCVIADTELPLPLDDEEAGRPILVGRDVWLGARVTLLPGAIVGDGAVVAAGSVVDGEIPPHAVASGVPARVLRVSTASVPVSQPRLRPVSAGVEEPAREVG